MYSLPSTPVPPTWRFSGSLSVAFSRLEVDASDEDSGDGGHVPVPRELGALSRVRDPRRAHGA
eukprot:1185103-Prorocentrum_minimum.AAC.4